MRTALGAVLLAAAAFSVVTGCKDPAATASVGAEPGFEGCEMACGTHRDYRPEDVVRQPGAKPGDLARCPVSDAVFDVTEASPSIVVDGKKVFTCCESCAAQFRKDPARFAARLQTQNAAH